MKGKQARPRTRPEVEPPKLFNSPMGKSMHGEGQGYEVNLGGFRAVVYPTADDLGPCWQWGITYGAALIGSDAANARFEDAQSAVSELELRLALLSEAIAAQVFNPPGLA